MSYPYGTTLYLMDLWRSIGSFYGSGCYIAPPTPAKTHWRATEEPFFFSVYTHTVCICIPIHSSPVDTYRHTKCLPQGTAITEFRGGLPSPQPIEVSFYYKHTRIHKSESGLGASWSVESLYNPPSFPSSQTRAVTGKQALTLATPCMHNGPL